MHIEQHEVSGAVSSNAWVETLPSKLEAPMDIKVNIQYLFQTSTQNLEINAHYAKGDFRSVENL